MKKAIIPVGLAILLNVIVMIINPNIEIAGNIMTGFFGLGIGVALNNLIFKSNKGKEKEEQN